MTELEQILNQLHLQNDPRLRTLAQTLQSDQGRTLSQGVSPQTASRIAQALTYAQQGNQAAAQQTVQDILRTPEGAQLAMRLKSLLRS